MDDLGAVREQEMVLAFLRAEIEAPRYREFYLAAMGHIGGSRQRLIDDADLANDSDNSDREKLLGMVRGYHQNAMLFAGFPSDTVWRRAKITLSELKTFRYANFPTLLELASSRRVSDGAENALKASGSFSPPLQDMLKGIRPLMKRVVAGETFEDLIVVKDAHLPNVVLLEGHTRSTAYVAAGEPPHIRVLIGTSAEMHEWALY
jgi:hypothetical protein